MEGKNKTFDLGNGKKRLIAYKRIDPTWQVGESTDDCIRSLHFGAGTLFDLTHPTYNAGAAGSDYYQFGSGARFTNITIPKRATIIEAYLTLRCNEAKSGTTVNSRISAEAVDDAPTFIDDGPTFDARYANNTVTVDWDSIPAWTLNTDYNSPDIKTVIQAIVDRGGWESGNAIVIFWEDFEDRSSRVSGAVRPAYSYNGSTTYAPKLVIEYQIPIPILGDGGPAGLLVGQGEI